MTKWLFKQGYFYVLIAAAVLCVWCVVATFIFSDPWYLLLFGINLGTACANFAMLYDKWDLHKRGY